MKKIWITADKPVGFSCPTGKGEFFHAAITQKMIDKKEPLEVPDNDFFNAKLREKDAEGIFLIKQVMPKKKVPKAPPVKEDTA